MVAFKNSVRNADIEKSKIVVLLSLLSLTHHLYSPSVHPSEYSRRIYNKYRPRLGQPGLPLCENRPSS